MTVRVGFIEFCNKLKAEGFRTNPHGNGEYCRQCWKKILRAAILISGVSYKEILEQDSTPTWKVAAEACRCSDGWFAVCEDCAKAVAMDFGLDDPHETKESTYRVDVYVDTGNGAAFNRLHPLLRRVPLRAAEARAEKYNAKRWPTDGRGNVYHVKPGGHYAMLEDEEDA